MGGTEIECLSHPEISGYYFKPLEFPANSRTSLHCCWGATSNVGQGVLLNYKFRGQLFLETEIDFKKYIQD